MSWAGLSTVLAALALLVGADRGAWSQETLKVAIPQRGAWDAGVAELGQRAVSSRSTAWTSKSFTSRLGPNRSRPSSAAAWILQPRPACPPPWALSLRARP